MNKALEHLNGLPLVRLIQESLVKNQAEARLVGGAIRDAIKTNRIPEVPDLDMAMTLVPTEAIRILEAQGLRIIPTGLDHGTITVLDKSNPALKIEMTTLRSDEKTDGRHAEVAFNADWQTDAARRDFTINAIYLDQEGTIFDPFNGIEDLKQGRVRFIGNAESRIREDYLRILRFFRFQAKFGTGQPDAEAIQAIEKNAIKIKTLSGERISIEMDRILALPAEALYLMAQKPISNNIIEKGFDFEIYEKFLSHFDTIIPPSLESKYSALIPYGATDAFGARLKMSKNRLESIQYIAEKIENPDDWNEQNLSKKAYQHRPNPEKQRPEGALYERYILSMVRSGQEPNRSIIKHLKHWTPPIFPLKGRDLLDQGFETGQEIGEILSVLEQHWIDHNFTPTTAELLSQAKAMKRQ